MTVLKSLKYLKNKCNLRLLILGEGDVETLLNYINRNKLNTMVKINRRINNLYPLIKDQTYYCYLQNLKACPMFY